MKLETLVKRYKNLGYEPKGLERDLEITSISVWLWDNYKINVEPLYMELDFNDGSYQKFSARYRTDCGDKWSQTFGNPRNKYFDSPFDARFASVKEIYGWVKSLS